MRSCCLSVEHPSDSSSSLHIYAGDDMAEREHMMPRRSAVTPLPLSQRTPIVVMDRATRKGLSMTLLRLGQVTLIVLSILCILSMYLKASYWITGILLLNVLIGIPLLLRAQLRKSR
jgi:hypothetical protein